jgi:hypothetical protein
MPALNGAVPVTVVVADMADMAVVDMATDAGKK